MDYACDHSLSDNAVLEIWCILDFLLLFWIGCAPQTNASPSGGRADNDISIMSISPCRLQPIALCNDSRMANFSSWIFNSSLRQKRWKTLIRMHSIDEVLLTRWTDSTDCILFVRNEECEFLWFESKKLEWMAAGMQEIIGRRASAAWWFCFAILVRRFLVFVETQNSRQEINQFTTDSSWTNSPGHLQEVTNEIPCTSDAPTYPPNSCNCIAIGLSNSQSGTITLKRTSQLSDWEANQK